MAWGTTNNQGQMGGTAFNTGSATAQQSPAPSGSTYSYYTPNQFLGPTYGAGEFWNSPVGNRYGEEQHDASYTRALAQLGYTDTTNAGAFARSQFGRFEGGYKAALGDDPFLTYRDYAEQNIWRIKDEYDRMSYAQRGENPTAAATRARTMNR